AFDLPLGTTVVARVFVHFERAVATYRVSGAREPEDVREGDRHRRDPLTYWPDERTSGLFIPERQITVASLTLTLVLRAGAIENQQPTDSGYHGVLCEITEQETRGPQRSAEPTVEEQVSLMEESFRAADALQTEVELDLEGEERQAAIDAWALCRQNYREGKARARARMVEARGEGPIGSGNVSAGMPAVRSSNGRLPEVTLPKFTGKVLEFPSFWAQFEANVHKRNDLDNATKFTYLLSNTEGTARNAIEGIPLTPENYPQAVDILKKRFGRPRQVIREHLAALWREPACREMSARGIQSL
ncbi:conserved hypothetical protein, partial [Trichinella spiralis]|uniref:hypothetical protein n=1 Tax=Trichinella spiralis TaxID=6334 RepID=UPI0001EFEBBE